MVAKAAVVVLLCLAARVAAGPVWGEELSRLHAAVLETLGHTKHLSHTDELASLELELGLDKCVAPTDGVARWVCRFQGFRAFDGAVCAGWEGAPHLKARLSARLSEDAVSKLTKAFPRSIQCTAAYPHRPTARLSLSFDAFPEVEGRSLGLALVHTVPVKIVPWDGAHATRITFDRDSADRQDESERETRGRARTCRARLIVRKLAVTEAGREYRPRRIAAKPEVQKPRKGPFSLRLNSVTFGLGPQGEEGESQYFLCKSGPQTKATAKMKSVGRKRYSWGGNQFRLRFLKAPSDGRVVCKLMHSRWTIGGLVKRIRGKHDSLSDDEDTGFFAVFKLAGGLDAKQEQRATLENAEGKTIGHVIGAIK